MTPYRRRRPCLTGGQTPETDAYAGVSAMFTLLFFATASVLYSSHPAHLSFIKWRNMISGCGFMANKSTNHVELHHLFLVETVISRFSKRIQAIPSLLM
ncbi:hypothetical protein M8C21_017003 [Ambrosia artemisiifolia]|uniref:Uncharacterized protein n=1 Tax=Ambrosia artemisiifolia TaxID=4212 RepID=A0AAD5C0Y0_AMBAR|nr:hypothetical protein M8C21_017003 [Ambrosia artemisiifolia]